MGPRKALKRRKLVLLPTLCIVLVRRCRACLPPRVQRGRSARRPNTLCNVSVLLSIGVAIAVGVDVSESAKSVLVAGSQVPC